MVDRSRDAEREARRAQAHAAVDAVFDVDPEVASGTAMTGAIEQRAHLEALVDGAVVSMLPQWEASGDWAAVGARSPITGVVNRTGARRSATAALRRTALDAAGMPHVSRRLLRGRCRCRTWSC